MMEIFNKHHQHRSAVKGEFEIFVVWGKDPHRNENNSLKISEKINERNNISLKQVNYMMEYFFRSGKETNC